VLGACVIIAQLVWLVVAEVHVELRGHPTLTLGDSVRIRFGYDSLTTSASMSRFLLFAGLSAATGLVFGMLFWYWRLARLGAEPARMVLLDTQWREARPDLYRQEKWRARAANQGAESPKPASRRGCSTFVVAAGVAVGVVAFLGLLAFCL